MAEDTSDHLTMYVLKIEQKHQEVLETIRHWQNLKVAFDEGFVWIKDFTLEQMASSEIQQIPFIVLYEVRDNLLFIKGSLLPQQKMPSALLWSPILRAFPIELPGLNHNYFGVNEQVSVQIVRSEKEEKGSVLITSLEDAKAYILSAPQVRLDALKWAVVEADVVLFGSPSLPIKGAAYWLRNDFLVPSGYDFEFPILAGTIQSMVNPDAESWVFWQKDSSYFKVLKTDVKPLSISSFRLTFSQ